MRTGLQQQRCLNHGEREAVARCPSCGFYFCRECITEHDERILCASCLKKQTPQTARPRRSFAPVVRTMAALCGLMIAWFFFYVVGRVLLATPTQFHEATVWKSKVEDEMQKDQTP
jgi:hypothetical protein